MGRKTEVVLMDINTKEQKTYDSIANLAREFGLTTATIKTYIKRKDIFRKKYYIIPKSDIVSNIIEDRLPCYLKKEKINMYTISGKYVKTFDNLKDIKYYIVDKCCNGNLYDFHYAYNEIIEIIDKDNRYIYGYMFRWFKNNEDCKDIEPYKCTSGVDNSSIVMTDLDGNIIGTYKSAREAARKCKGLISYVTIQRILNDKLSSSKGYIFKRIPDEDLEDSISSGRLESIVSKKSLLTYKDEILESNLSDDLKDKLIKFLEQ